MKLPFGRRGPRRVPRPADLLDALQQLAACPCAAHQTAFVSLFEEADEVLFEVVDADTPVVNGEQRTVSSEDRLSVRLVMANDQQYLLAFPDHATALRHDRAAAYAGMTPAAAAAMAIADPNVAGILVTAADDANAWAAVTVDHLATLVEADR